MSTFVSLSGCSNAQQSTLLALHLPPLSAAHTANAPGSQRSTAAIHEITTRIRTKLIGNECLVGREPETMSPWGLYFAYHICRIHLPSRRTSAVSAEVVKSLKDTFTMIDTRWSAAGRLLGMLPCSVHSHNSAGVYLQLLEAQEAMSSC